MAKWAIIGVVVIFVVFYIATSPDHAASIFHASWHAAVNIAHGIGRFVDKVS